MQLTLSGKRAARALYTPALGEQIAEMVRTLGVHHEAAAASLGVLEDVARYWWRAGRFAYVNDRSDDALVHYALVIMAAEGKAEVDAVGTMKAHASTDPATARWALETRHPKRWKTRLQEAVRAEIDVFLAGIESKLDPETFLRVMRAAAEIVDGEQEVIRVLRNSRTEDYNELAAEYAPSPEADE
jgi:hypothetical protein